MTHNHENGWPLCACGIRYRMGCPICDAVHIRLHHRQRRRRLRRDKDED